MNELVWLFVAFMAVWVGLGLYAYSLMRRQSEIERRIADLEQRRPGD